MEIAGAAIVSVAVLFAEGLLVGEALIVTVLSIGIEVGAVYKATAPAVVCVGEIVPQAPFVVLPVTGLPSQVTLQSTPAFRLSLIGVIVRSAFAPVAREVNCPLTAPVGSVTEIAPALLDKLLPQPAKNPIAPTEKTRTSTRQFPHIRIAPLRLSRAERLT
jgi:hypothetical protein